MNSLQPDIYGVLTARLQEACAAARQLATAAACESHVSAGAAHLGIAPPAILAADFGCGTGSWLRALAALCDHVLGIDDGLDALQTAAATTAAAGLDERVRLLRRDLGGKWPLVASGGGAVWGGAASGGGSGGQWPWCHVAVCANEALASPDQQHRHQGLRNVRLSLRPGGVALLLVRAAESAELVEAKRLKLGWAEEAVSGSGPAGRRCSAGGVCVAGARAAAACYHYRRDELVGAAAAAGLQVRGDDLIAI